jgi:hypothetical protein
MPERWCIVTVTDGDGRRHSIDVKAASTYDAAQLFVTHAGGNPQAGLPALTLNTVFEVIVSRKVHEVKGDALQRWISERREEWKGPRGLLFKQRPSLAD